MPTIAMAVGEISKMRMVADDHVDAGRHHGGRMNQRADGRGAFHRVRQPGVQRKLRRLSDGADEQTEGDGGGHVRWTDVRRCGEDLRVVERLEIDEDQKNREQKSGVADAIHDECFGGRFGRRHFFVVIADQQIGAEPDAFPPDEQHHIVVAHDQQAAWRP